MTDVAQRAQPVEVAVDPGGEDLLLRAEVVVEAAGAGGEAGGGLDRGHAGAAETVVAEEGHRRVDDAVAGGG